jgi:DnaJ domain
MSGWKGVWNPDMDKTAYPLCWPDRRPHTIQKSTNRNFKQSFASSRDKCAAEIRRLGGTGLIISSNIRIKRDGMPEAVDWGKVIKGDPGVAVYFKRNGKEMCFACDRWLHVQDNMYAIALTIEALRGIARWGTGDMMEAAFTGFLALPAVGESSASDWWKTLGLTINATVDQARDAYRILAKKHHPDAGGDPELFRRINEAWQSCQKQVAA